MNVLEKILEEIEERVNFRERLVKYEKRRGTVTDVCRNKGALEELDIIAKIIRSHMNHSGDDTEMGDWIPVEERLPEVPEGLADEYCPEFNVTIKGAERTTTLKYSWDGTWFDDNGNVYNVIAWQPLPAPYKPKKNIPVAGMDHIMSGFTKVE